MSASGKLPGKLHRHARCMLLHVKTATCPNCESERLVKDGTTSSGSQRYLCRDCGKSRVLEPKRTNYTGQEKERILAAYREGTSLRGLERIFGVARQTVSAWLKKK